MDGQPENRLRKLLFNEVSFIVAAVSLAFGVYFTFSNPQRDTDAVVAEIKAQFTAHEKLQDARNADVDKYMYNLQNGDFKDFKADILENRSEIAALRESVVRLQTIIEERLPAKK